MFMHLLDESFFLIQLKAVPLYHFSAYEFDDSNHRLDGRRYFVFYPYGNFRSGIIY